MGVGSIGTMLSCRRGSSAREPAFGDRFVVVWRSRRCRGWWWVRLGGLDFGLFHLLAFPVLFRLVWVALWAFDG